MDICIDFDGTCLTHEFPKVGRDIGAVPVLKELVENGHRLILFTMRSDGTVTDGHPPFYLTDALGWFMSHDIPLYGIQTHPTQSTWTTSPKAYGQLYIDDAALGCPLVYPEGGRPYVDWMVVSEFLRKSGLLSPFRPAGEPTPDRSGIVHAGTEGGGHTAESRETSGK